LSRRITNSTTLVAGAAAALLALTACSSGVAPTAEVSSADEPRYGGTLTFLEPQAPTCAYSAHSYYPNATIMNQVGAKLTYQDPETLEITPWLATSWEVNEEATEYTFELRDDVTFSDGTPLEAATVALNFDHFGLGDAALGLAKQEFVSNYDHSEVVDENTVTFVFSAPSPGFLQATSVVGATIVARATAELPLEEQCQYENYVSLGPFTIENVVPEQQYDLAVREDYDWAPEISEHQGRAYVDAISIVVTPEDNVRTGALSSNQADAIRGVQVYDVPGLEQSGATVEYASINGVNALFALRPGNELLSDERVREALVLGTDVSAAVDSTFQGEYTRATSVLSSRAAGYVDLSDELAYDPGAAREILDEAGWVPGEDGIRVKDGRRLELTTWTAVVYPLNQELDELIAEQWEDIGVKLIIETPDAATSTATQKDPNEVGVYLTQVGRADPDVISSAFLSTSTRNVLVWQDPELDAILTDISRLPDAADRVAKAQEAQEYLVANHYVIPLYELPQTYATAAATHGLGWEAVGRLWLYDTWLSE